MTRTKLCILAVMVLAATGCAKKVKTSYLDEPKDPNGEQKKHDDSDVEKMLSECTLHFGFDDASLTAADQTILRKVSDTLRKRSWIAIRIAGHTDERGTEEYNMALGMKRADAARQYLIALGVSEEQVDSVSFGEEKPLVPESSEEGWAYNRRDEIGIMPLELYGLLGARPVEVLK